ncbi:MAG: 16S rRNA (guanine(966)-N(2))-methyltransferase RsmD [Geobacteraceae bacterium]|nr:16S rRNA (guanine(966)-N(2))-methyltransferase RsmD [Geobacteraceae bacterium]
MRVIAGSARGLRLTAPAGLQTRPTGDRVKEALFSIIASRRQLAAARILDICAGTGSLGIEALSRGAASCCFIEQDRQVMALLEKNLATTGLAAQAECLVLEAVKGLTTLNKRGKSFDIVFLDPPYSSNLYPLVAEALSSTTLLMDRGLLVAECSSRNPLAERYGELVRIDRRVYGDTALEFFSKEIS